MYYNVFIEIETRYDTLSKQNNDKTNNNEMFLIISLM